MQATVFTVVLATSAKWSPTTISPSGVVTSIPSGVTFTASLTSTQIKHKLHYVRSDVYITMVANLPDLLRFLVDSFYAVKASSTKVSAPESPQTAVEP